MTHDEMIAVIQAHKDGAAIQSRRADALSLEWHKCEIPYWDFQMFDYRVKPREPRRIWVNIFEGHTPQFLRPEFTKEGADRGGAHRIDCIEFVEVLPPC